MDLMGYCLKAIPQPEPWLNGRCENKCVRESMPLELWTFPLKPHIQLQAPPASLLPTFESFLSEISLMGQG